MVQDGENEAENYNLIVAVFDAKANYLQRMFQSGEIVYNKNNEDPTNFILRLKSLKKALSDDDLARSSDSSISEENPNSKVKLSNRDIGYHGGDLGKSESLGMQGGGRNTGHFGTSAYIL